MLNVRDAAIVAITSASLSLLAMSVAQAHGGEKKPVHRATYNATQHAPTVNRATPTPDETFHNFSTSPEGSPDYRSGGVG